MKFSMTGQGNGDLFIKGDDMGRFDCNLKIKNKKHKTRKIKKFFFQKNKIKQIFKNAQNRNKMQ